MSWPVRIATLSKGVSPFSLTLNGQPLTLNGQYVTLTPKVN